MTTRRGFRTVFIKPVRRCHAASATTSFMDAPSVFSACFRCAVKHKKTLKLYTRRVANSNEQATTESWLYIAEAVQPNLPRSSRSGRDCTDLQVQSCGIHMHPFISTGPVPVRASFLILKNIRKICTRDHHRLSVGSGWCDYWCFSRQPFRIDPFLLPRLITNVFANKL